MNKWVTFLLLLSMQTPSFAQEALPAFTAVTPPSWEMFCPTKYCNAESGPVHKNPGWWWYALWIAPGGIFISAPVISYKEKVIRKEFERNYWASRKLQFQNEIEQCNEYADKGQCYLYVHQLEEQKTADREAHLDRVAIKHSINAVNKNITGMRYQMLQQK